MDLKTAQDALTAETAKLTTAQSDLATAQANSDGGDGQAGDCAVLLDRGSDPRE